MKQKIKEYLLEKGIKSEEQLAVHIIELKRNTVVPKIMFELVDLLVNNKDCLLSFFADNRLKEECIRIGVLPLDFPKGYKTLPQEDDYEDNFWIDFSKLVDDVVDTSKEAQDRWTQTVTGEKPRKIEYLKQEKSVEEVLKEKNNFVGYQWVNDLKEVNEKRQEKVKTVLDDIIKDDVIFKSNIAEKETMDFLKEPYKETEGKLYYELSWEFIEAMAQRMQFHKNGKYELYNWKNKPMTPKGIEDMKQAINRHHIEVMKGDYDDGEELLGHIVSYATNSMILWEQLKLNKS